MNILITGACGFIGSHLCKRMLDEGNEVICLDNYFTGAKENIISLRSLRSLRVSMNRNPKCSVLRLGNEKYIF